MEKAANIESPVQLHGKCCLTFPSTNDERSQGIALLKDYVKGKPANHVSFDHEIPVLAPLLQQVEDILASYDEAMEILQSKRDDLYALQHRARGMIRPSIRSLPPELLVFIFAFCKSPELSARSALQPTCHTILTLSHVCAHWRATISSEPTLWSNIHIRFKVRDDKTIARRIHSFTKFCLEKSKARPLNIYFDTPSEYDGYRNEDDDWITYSPSLHRRTLREVVKHNSRWRDVTLNLKERETIDLPDSLPFLESLHVYYHSSYLTAFEDRVDTPISTPRLHDLYAHGIEAHVLARLDTRSLVRLSTTVCDFVVILNVLRDSPTLREVSLFRPIAALDDTPAPGNIVYSQLRSLKTFFGPQSDVIFQHLSLPSLTVLEVSGEQSDTGNDRSALLAFLQRSRPPLSELSIRELSFTPEDWTRMLKLLPSITELCLQERSLHSEQTGIATIQLLEKLTISATMNLPSRDILLPNLTSLNITALRPFNDNVVLAVVQSRLSGAERAGVKRLESLFLECHEHQLDDHVYNALDRLSSDDELDVDIDLLPEETTSEVSYASDSESESDN